MNKFAKTSTIVAGITLCLAGVGLGIWKFAKHRASRKIDEIGRHVGQVDWLPKEASDISYRKQDGFFWLLCYECKLPREAFDRFAKSNGWTVKEARNINVHAFRPMLELPPVRQEDPTADIYPITLHYEERQQNGGGITVVYDMEAQRLFVWESSN